MRKPSWEIRNSRLTRLYKRRGKLISKLVEAWLELRVDRPRWRKLDEINREISRLLNECSLHMVDEVAGGSHWPQCCY